MDTTALESVYARLLAVAAEGEFAPPSDPAEWPAELVIAHVTVNDDLLIEAVRAVLANMPTPVYDNASAIDTEHLRSMGTLPELIDKLRTSSRQLCDLAAQLGPLGDTPVNATIKDGDELRVDGQSMPIGDLVRIHAEVHLPSHLSQLEQLRS